MKSIEQLELLEELILDGTRVPFSSGRLVDEQEAIQVIEELRNLIPRELDLAHEIVNNNKRYIESAKTEARNIIKDAESQKINLISSSSVKREAEKQIAQLRNSAQSEYNGILKNASLKQKQIERAYKEKEEVLEQRFTTKLNSLTREYGDKRSDMEISLMQEHKKIKTQLTRDLKNINEQIHELTQRKVILEREIEVKYNKSVSDIKNNIEQAKLYADNIINNSKKEAESLKQDAYCYVHDQLEELNHQVLNISRSIIKGKKYLQSNDVRLESNEGNASLRNRAKNIINKLK